MNWFTRLRAFYSNSRITEASDFRYDRHKGDIRQQQHATASREPSWLAIVHRTFDCTLNFEAGANILIYIELWRKGWDSNPRYPCRHAGFQDRCLKPLGHPSDLGIPVAYRTVAPNATRTWTQFGPNRHARLSSAQSGTMLPTETAPPRLALKTVQT